MSHYLDVTAVTKRFGAATVLDRLDFAVTRGEFVSLLGPSGCGKTTLLRLIAGLLTADGGAIRLDGRDLTSLPAHKRNVGVVFQNYALFPHLTVAENVAFGLRAHRVARAEIAPTVAQALDLVHLGEFADRAVTALSGGQAQRVAVARALAVRPALLLLDEPFSALDRKLRETMQIELKRLLRDVGITAVFVTHDQDEALIMSDRIAVMNRGAIEQFATPTEIYDRPASAFALEFVGLSTRLAGRVASAAGASLAIDTALGRVQARGNFATGAKVLVGVRPERIRVDGAGANVAKLRVIDLAFLGSKLIIHFAAQGEDRVMVEANPGGFALPAIGDELPLAWSAEDTLVYPAS